ncbi:MAG: thioredoxin family protein [Bacteroidetes bacterium]|nr:MAG: thioredoxin family protein [Bacteroidota bacterium]TAG89740.1 MAG: thioredoxin family protein [Bacteroidota bacterium]
MKKIVFVFLFVISFAFLSMRNTGYQVGDTAADFKLKNINDKKVSLKDYKKAKGFIVIFTCNHCPFSVANEDRIIALHKKYEEKGYPVVAINPNDVVAYPDDSFENMKIRAKEKNFNFAYLIDETQEVAKAFGATKTPHVFVLDKKLVVKYIGAIDDAAKDESKVSEKFLENAIDALVEGKNIDKTSTKAVGCGIKWKK